MHYCTSGLLFLGPLAPGPMSPLQAPGHRALGPGPLSPLNAVGEGAGNLPLLTGGASLLAQHFSFLRGALTLEVIRLGSVGAPPVSLAPAPLHGPPWDPTLPN